MHKFILNVLPCSEDGRVGAPQFAALHVQGVIRDSVLAWGDTGKHAPRVVLDSGMGMIQELTSRRDCHAVRMLFCPLVV